MPSTHVRKETQDQDTEMVDAESMRSKMASTSGYQPVVPALPGASSSSNSTRPRTTVTNLMKFPSETKQNPNVVPQTTSINFGSVEQMRKENADLKKALKSAALECEKLRSNDLAYEQNNSTLETCLRVLSQENDGLTQQREKLIKEREKLWKECGDRDRHGQELGQRYNILRGENQTLREQLGHLKESSQRAIIDNNALQERLDQQELSVTKAQNAAMSVLSNSLSAALPDDRIRHRFSELFERITEWARDNAATPGQAMLTNPKIIRKWQRCGLFRQVREAGSMPDLNFDFEDETAVDTLLNAALTRRLCRDFLDSPFWFVDKSISLSDLSLPQGERLDTTRVLEHMLKKMMADCESQAKVHAWRAVTVQTLASSNKASEKISASHRRYLEDKLLRSYAELIRDPLPESEVDDLLTIIKSFGEFSIELWSEKSEVCCLYLEHFDKALYNQANEEIEIAQAVGIEDGDTRLDGRPIPVVVQPLIAGLGTHDGKDYDKVKIWSKAVVWVSKNEESAATLASDEAGKTSLSRYLAPWRFII